MRKNGFSTILVILIIIGVTALGTGGYFYYKNSSAKQEEKTKETKIEENKENQDNKLDEEGTIRKFFALVDEGNVDEAVKMMSTNMASSENTKNTWKQSLAGFESIKVTKIEKSDNLGQQDKVYMYKVTLDVQLKPDNQLMNWNNGQEIRFVSVVKNSDNVWQINEIATGP